ncbi:MAG: sulfite exporter TauE/SafE family protein [Gemmatimonadaceae bacterium]|nr:sulfite exporter TauE/SafE family protein [Gemmatimonadaceae bacterium]
MPLWSVLLVVGLGAGVLSGLFGIGGGIVIVPALIYFAKFGPQQAVGTSLGALLLPVGALGAWSYYKGGQLDVRASLLIAAGIFVAAPLGAKLAQTLEPVMLKRAFGVLLLFVAYKLFRG